MKNYPLEIEAYNENYGYWSKGHHDKQAFIDEVKKMQRRELFLGAVEHVWVRYRPALPHEREEYGYAWYHADAKKGERGAFPVTRVQL